MTAEKLWEALMRDVRDNGPILVWTGDGKFPGKSHRGLGLNPEQMIEWAKRRAAEQKKAGRKP